MAKRKTDPYAAREKARVLRALLVNTIEARADEGFTGMHVEDQQTYLQHCTEVAAEIVELLP